MKRVRILAAVFLVSLLCQSFALGAAPAADERWTRTEDGGYVTIRVPAASDPQTVDVFQLAVRYADTQEPVALSSTYLDGYLFATVPASEAGRPLEVFQGTQPVWTDLEQPYLAVQGASELNIRGVIFGDKAGRLKQDAPLTRAEAAVIAARLLDLRPSGDPGYRDVSPEDWFYEAVRYVYDRGLMNGITSTTFGPNRTTERGMIVTILYRLEGEPTVGASTFSDVASNFYYTDAIAWAAENDIVNGYPDGTFRPGQAITRQEMATILYRYASYKGYDVSASASLSGYTDAAQVGAYAADAMAWANATGLVTGTTVTTLTPTGGATRAQVATILMRFLNTLA